MNELLQKHGCANVFNIPEGLKELMADISREVLRDQPPKMFDYIANYLSVLLITREHGILAVKILDDLCDCRPSVSEHLLQLGIPQGTATMLSGIIKEEVEKVEPIEGKEKVKETMILKKILAKMPMDEEMSANVCQVARNAYRDYWYRKKLMQKEIKVGADDEPWEIAARRTLELYMRTKPSFSELSRATEQIQAAYKGYHVRRRLLRHLKPQKPKGPKVILPGPPLDVAGSRSINLGPVINLPAVPTENAAAEFDDVLGENLHLGYDPMKTITHEPGMEDEKTRDAAGGAKSVIISDSKLGSVSGEQPLVPLEDNSEIPLDDTPAKEKRRSRFLEGGEEEQAPGVQIAFFETPEVAETETDIPEELTTAFTSDEGQEYASEVPEEITSSALEVTDSADEADDSTAVPDDSAADAPDSANVSAPVTDAEVTTEEEGE